MIDDIKIKEEIMTLCDDFIVFWNQLKENIALIDDNNVDLVLQWHNFFAEHRDIVAKLNKTKMHIESIEERLVSAGELRCEYDR